MRRGLLACVAVSLLACNGRETSVVVCGVVLVARGEVSSLNQLADCPQPDPTRGIVGAEVILASSDGTTSRARTGRGGTFQVEVASLHGADGDYLQVAQPWYYGLRLGQLGERSGPIQLRRGSNGVVVELPKKRARE